MSDSRPPGETTVQAALRALPSVSRLLDDPEIRSVAARMSPPALARLVAAELDAARASILAGKAAGQQPTPKERVLQRINLLLQPGLSPLINATGVILHTNLGRAPVSASTADAMRAAMRGYTPLELDLAMGTRGGRMDEVEALLIALTGAEAGLIVNNNAAATTLVLATLAAGRAVVLSRGEAVEIGGGFRIPDVMAQSGARLIEVGTTNRTYAHDYASAIDADTAALLKVHSSNFRIIGFTHEATVAELVALGRAHDLAVINDLGSGALRDTTPFGLAHEPTVGESVAAGATVTLFSGDKLLGGPQAGIIVGERAALRQIARHPLARAFRADKATLAGTVATLRHYLLGEELAEIPVWRMIAADEEALRQRATGWHAALGQASICSEVVAARSTIGGGSLPEETLPTWALAIAATADQTIDGLAAALRQGDPAVIGRIADDRLLLDPRTVFPDDEARLLERLIAALRR